MKAIYIKQNAGTKEVSISRQDLAEKFNLNTRDLRPIFSIFQVATILPRQSALVINLGFIKAVLSKNEAYFFTHKESDTYKAFIEKVKSINSKLTEDDFFLKIFEEILKAKIAQMQGKVAKIQSKIEEALKEVRRSASEKNLKELLVVQKRISSLEVRLKEIQSAIMELLDDEENFDELVGVGIDSKEARLEAESILEDFLEQIEEELGKITRLKEEIEDTQDYLNLKLSSSRTTIVRFDLIATITTLVMSLLAVIVGLFGVNIKNGFEESHTAFAVLSISLIALFVVLVSIMLYYLKKREVL